MKNSIYKLSIVFVLLFSFCHNAIADKNNPPYEVEGNNRVFVISKNLHKNDIQTIQKDFAASGAVLTFENMKYNKEGYFISGTIEFESSTNKGKVSIDQNKRNSIFPRIIYTTDTGAIGVGIFEAQELQKRNVKISSKMLSYYQDQFPLVFLNGKLSSRKEVNKLFENCASPTCRKAIQDFQTLSPEESLKRFGKSNSIGAIVFEL